MTHRTDWVRQDRHEIYRFVIPEAQQRTILILPTGTRTFTPTSYDLRYETAETPGAPGRYPWRLDRVGLHEARGGKSAGRVTSLTEVAEEWPELAIEAIDHVCWFLTDHEERIPGWITAMQNRLKRSMWQ